MNEITLEEILDYLKPRFSDVDFSVLGEHTIRSIYHSEKQLEAEVLTLIELNKFYGSLAEEMNNNNGKH